MSEKFIPRKQERADELPEAEQGFAVQVGGGGIAFIAEHRRKVTKRTPDDERSRRAAELGDPKRGLEASMRRHPAGTRRTIEEESS